MWALFMWDNPKFFPIHVWVAPIGLAFASRKLAFNVDVSQMIYFFRTSRLPLEYENTRIL